MIAPGGCSRVRFEPPHTGLGVYCRQCCLARISCAYQFYVRKLSALVRSSAHPELAPGQEAPRWIVQEATQVSGLHHKIHQERDALRIDKGLGMLCSLRNGRGWLGCDVPAGSQRGCRRCLRRRAPGQTCRGYKLVSWHAFAQMTELQNSPALLVVIRLQSTCGADPG